MAVNLPLTASKRLPVRGVLLDVFETLFSTARLHAAFAASGLDVAQAPLWLSLVFSSGIACTAAHDYRRFDDIALKVLLMLGCGQVSRKEAQAVLRALEELEPHPDTAQGLALLRQAGIRVLTLSLLSAETCAALFARAGLQGQVDGYLSVEAVRRWKPSPEAYAYGVAQVGWPPSQVALISAHDWDIHGARRAGLQTGQVIRCSAAPSPIFEHADAAGADLPSVVELLLHGK